MLDGLIDLSRWIPKGQLRTEILNFDLDTFITAMIKYHYTKESIIRHRRYQAPVFLTFRLWTVLLDQAVRCTFH